MGLLQLLVLHLLLLLLLLLMVQFGNLLVLLLLLLLNMLLVLMEVLVQLDRLGLPRTRTTGFAPRRWHGVSPTGDLSHSDLGCLGGCWHCSRRR